MGSFMSYTYIHMHMDIPVHTYVYTNRLCRCAHTHTHTYPCAHDHVCWHTQTHPCIHFHSTLLQRHMCARVITHIHTHTYAYTFAIIHKYHTHAPVHTQHSKHTSREKCASALIYPAGHVTATQPSHALQTIHGEMQISGYLGPVFGSHSTRGELSAIQRDAIINGLLFPINNMTDCAYNASCFDAGSKGPASNFLSNPTSFRLISPDVVTRKLHMYIIPYRHYTFADSYGHTHMHTCIQYSFFI